MNQYIMLQGMPQNQMEILSTKGQKGDMLALKYATDELRRHNFPHEDSWEVARLFLEPILDKLLKKLPDQAQLLVMPSTSGRNLLPVVIAEVLQEYKPEVVIHNQTLQQIRPLHQAQSKQQGNYMARMEDPVRYSIEPGLIHQLKQTGGKVVLVDDVTSTLDSSRALALQLGKEDIRVTGIVALRASSTSYPSEKALVQVYQKIEPHLAPQQQEAFSRDFMEYFAHSSSAKLYRFSQSLNELTDFKKVQQVITRGAQHFRELAGESVKERAQLQATSKNKPVNKHKL